MDKELVMYGRRYGCIDQYNAVNFLDSQAITYRFIDISADHEAAARVQQWVGHLSVPTIIVAEPGGLEPVSEPAPLDRSRRTRGQNRGTLITEPSTDQLEDFLRQHQLI